MENTFAVGLLVLAAACLLDLPFASKFNRTLAGFFLMDGRLRLPGFVSSILAANLSIGNFLVFIASWAFVFGWGGLFWFMINLALNVIAYLIFMPAFRTYIEDRNNSGTIHEFLATTYGHSKSSAKRIRFVASATTIFGLLFAIVFELHLAASILAPLLHTDVVLLFGVLTALICIFSGIGGFQTLIFTDIVQSIAMFVGSVAIIGVLIALAGLPATMPLSKVYPFALQSWNIGWPSIVGICVVGSGWFLIAMDQWQRTCATRNAKRSSRGMIWYLACISGFALIYALVGMYDKAAILPNLSTTSLASSTHGTNPLVDIFLASSITNAPPYLFGLFALALLTAALSTANTFLIVCGHSFVSDLLLAVAKNASIHTLSKIQERVFLAIARGSIVFMGVFVLGAWWLLTSLGLLTDPLNFFFIAYSIQFALLAPMACARFPARWRPGGDAVFRSIWVGVIFSLVWGLGFWTRLQFSSDPIFGIAGADLLALTPVATLAMGLFMIVVTRNAAEVSQ